MPAWTTEQRNRRIDELLAWAPVLPVVVIERLEDAVPLARTLVEAGLPVLEITLRTDVALAAIRLIVEQVPGAVVGAGTVLDGADLAAVAAAGAVFAISPGATESLYTAAAAAGIPWLPAIATASELMRGLEHGHQRFKFFPAESAGGITTLKAFAGPFAHARFCPTGGIDAAKAGSYLRLPNVMTVGGSWMLPKQAIERHDWSQISELARECAKLTK